MNPELAGTLAVLGISIVLFLSERLRPDVIALAVAAVLAGMGILTADEAFAGFSSKAVITLISVFILAEGLTRTGVSEQAGRLLLRWGGRREGRLVALVMLSGAGLSLFMNNIAAAAVLFPAAGAASRRAGISPSRVLLPLAFATILGGMATLLTTMNIVVGSILEASGQTGYGLLDFLPVGLPMMLAGIIYMVFWGRHRLPTGIPGVPRADGADVDLIKLYGIAGHSFRARIPAGSYLIGRTISESTFRELYGLNVIALESRHAAHGDIDPETVLREGDIVVLEGLEERFRSMDRAPYLEILPSPPLCEQDLHTGSTMIAEAMLSPRGFLIGKTLSELHFRQRYGMTVLAVWREGLPISDGLAEQKLKFGDALLLQGSRIMFRLLENNQDDLILLSSERRLLPVKSKGKVALAILGATLTAILFTEIPMAQLLLSGAVLMLLSGAVTMNQAYRTIDWRSIFLVAGMLALSLAMTKSGAAAASSSALLSLFGSLHPMVTAAVLFLVSALLTQAVSGAAVAAIMAPIAVSAAVSMGSSPQALGMAVALGSSMAFLTPLGHPVNTLVMGAGAYRFRDYTRVGWPLFLILAMVAIAGLAARYFVL
jgi:di/tricarboxylate transporter